MRIGIDARKLHDYGIGTYIRNLLRELANIDRQTEYVLFTRPQDVAVAASLGENFRAVPDRSGHYSIAEQLSIPLGVKRERLDLFHATHYVLPALTPSKTVVTIHDCIHLMFPDYTQRRLGHAYAKASLYTAAHKSDRILTVSESSKRDILKFFKVSPDKIVVTPNAIDDRFSAPPSDEHVTDTRERYQLSHSYLLYVGNIKPHKNLERLIEAFHLVRNQGRSELELLIIGDEISKLQALRRAVHKYDIHRYVRFLGYVPDKTLAVLYRLASVFVFPSLYEGFGLPPLEAMASGTPVVTSNVSSLPEVVGNAAVLVDPYDAAAIAHGIATVLRSTHLRGELRERGLNRVQEFSWARSVRRVRNVYDEVLS
ncbi:MAG TPA: glycosyltransferase family 1 protein [Vicinamibacterales bacterium]|nr:glycosyltransferase family 1 protein [Vicinamibacterales bacterium]